MGAAGAFGGYSLAQIAFSSHIRWFLANFLNQDEV